MAGRIKFGQLMQEKICGEKQSSFSLPGIRELFAR